MDHIIVTRSATNGREHNQADSTGGLLRTDFSGLLGEERFSMRIGAGACGAGACGVGACAVLETGAGAGAGAKSGAGDEGGCVLELVWALSGGLTTLLGCLGEKGVFGEGEKFDEVDEVGECENAEAVEEDGEFGEIGGVGKSKIGKSPLPANSGLGDITDMYLYDGLPSEP